MKQHVKSLILIFLTAGVFFGLLAGGQFIFKNYYVADRFQDKLIRIDGVTKVEINEQIIFITVSTENNIKKSYQEISQIINDQNYQIKIKDNPSQKLEKIAEECEIALEEGAFRGNFTEMNQYIQNITKNQGMIAQIYVDQERVYLKLTSNEQYIYRIIERPNKMI